jgi:hypothetical protein
METTENRHLTDIQPVRVRRLRAHAADASSSRESEDVPSAANSGGSRERMSAQDQIPTPPPLEPVAYTSGRGPVRSRSSCVMWAALGFCLVASVASLVLSVLLVTRLLTVRQAVADGLDQAISGLNNMEVNGFAYDYHLQQTIPFSGEIPFQQEFIFPFKGNVPINTTVTVPIDAGILGQFTLDVPINTTFPVDIEVPIEISQTFAVDTEVPVDMVIPIAISPDDPGIDRLLKGIRDWLLGLRQLL